MLKSLKSVSSNYTFICENIGILQLINILFSFCSSNTQGGAVLLKNPSISFYSLFSSFLSCKSVQLGGAICSLNSNLSLYKSNCFLNCSSAQCNSIVYRGGSYNINEVQFNLTDEFCPYLNLMSTNLVVDNIVIVNYFNCSYSYTSYYSSNLRIGSLIKSTCFFSQFVHSKGPAIFGTHTKINNQIIELVYLNFINNTFTNGLFEIYFGNCYPSISFSNFINISTNFLTYSLESGSGYPIFNNCKFDILFNENFHQSISISNNYFNIIILDKISMELYNTKDCWNGFLIVLTTNINFFTLSPLKIFLTKIIYEILIY